MAKPEGGGGGGSCRVGIVSLGVTLVAVAGLAVSVMCLDAVRRDQLTQLKDQLDTLQQLVDSMQNQLDRQQNATESRVVVQKAPAEENYEDEVYEYDNTNEGSYEYEDDEEEEPNPKGTVKRTAVLGESTLVGNLTEESMKVHTQTAPSRSRRDVRSQAVPVREESPSKSMEDYIANNARTEKSSTQLRTSVYQEQVRPRETTVKLRHRGRSRNINDNVELMSGEEFSPPEKPPHHLLAAHFVGSSSSYNIRDHPHYYGNGILYHPSGQFEGWVPANWMLELGSNQHFPLQSGKLTIQKPGVYFVYAQVYYAATHDRCGFHIKRNGIEVAQCTLMSTGRTLKRNTCFTAVTVLLNKSDTVWVSEIEGHRNTSFKTSHSFFGLIQLIPT